MELSRRAILSGLIAAPAVVAVGNIMPVRLWDPLIWVGQHQSSWEYVTLDFANECDFRKTFIGTNVIQMKESELALARSLHPGDERLWKFFSSDRPRKRWDYQDGEYKSESEPRTSIYMQRDNGAPAHPCTIHTEEVVFSPYEPISPYKSRSWTS